MALTNSSRLFDVTTRLALFVEGIKLGQTREFNLVLNAVDDEIKKLLSRVKYKTLDGLSKAELNKLLMSLHKSQLKIYSAYTEKLIQALQDFMQVRLDTSAIVYASIKHSFSNEELIEFSEKRAYEYIEEQSNLLPFAPIFGLAAILPSGKTSLWSTIKNAPIPANGLYLLPFIQTFSRSAQASVINTIRRAYANKQPVSELIADLSGQRNAQGNSTQFAKIAAQASAVIDTAFAHVDQIVSQGLVSALFEYYKWVSVIDNATTEICRSRDDKVFRYGSGPMPPAHYKCRSITVPLASLFDDFNPPTLYAWLKQQPPEIQREFLGKEIAALLRAGRLSAKDFASIFFTQAIDVKQLKSKIGLILST